MDEVAFGDQHEQKALTLIVLGFSVKRGEGGGQRRRHIAMDHWVLGESIGVSIHIGLIWCGNTERVEGQVEEG